MSHQNPYTISPIAAAVSAAIATPATAIAQQDDAGAEIENIIVTATKREANVQEIPAAIQAIPESMLKDMGALSTEDYARFIPSMVWRKTSGAGSNQIIFRGINDGPDSFIAVASSGMYLDETSITSIGDQPDIRMMDVARIEALPGPQGTLFGATAQGGTLRVITNQPDTSNFEASVDASLFTGSESDASHSVTGIVNIPLVEDVFAIRIAAQTAEDGGFIDNVPGHTPDTWFGLTVADVGGGRYPWYTDGGDINVRQSYGRYFSPIYSWPYGLSSDKAEWGTLDNSAVAEENWNTVEHTAVKVAARWDINDDWSATLTYNDGDNEAMAFNDYNPFVGDLQTIAMTHNRTHEEWDLTSLTIEADLGFAQFVSATSIYNRNFEYQYDGTFYYKYWHMWACEDWGPAGSWAGYGADPNSLWTWDDPVTGRNIYYPTYCVEGPPRGSDPTQQADYIGLIEGPSWQDKMAQEFRLSHQGESFDWLVGLYYEDSEDNWDSVWMKAKDVDFQNTTSLRFAEARFSDPTFCANNYVDPAAVGCGPGTTFPDAEYIFLTTDRTDWEQRAVFGEVTWHINDEWDVTVGGRWFKTTNDKEYLKYHAGHTLPNGRQQGGIIRWDYAPDSDQIFLSDGSKPVHGEIDEFVPKLAVSWNFSDDKMVYASYTEGFRPGGVNRANGRADWSRTVFPQVWQPDKLKSSEIGAKTVWAGGRVQLNLTYFNMSWEDFQVELVDPSFGDCVDPAEAPPCLGLGSLPWLKVVGNAGDAVSEGIEAQFAWVPADGWDIGANAQWLEAETDEDLVLDPRAGTVLPKGTPLPNVPDFKGSAWASYSWPMQFLGSNLMVLRGDYSYQGSSQNILENRPPDELVGGRPQRNPSFTNHSYSIANARFSLISEEGGWQVDLFVNNLTDERAEIYHGTGNFEWAFGHTGEYEHVARVYTNRPREWGARFYMEWGDN
jgi:iron complex outermembrane receptor protein